MNGTSGFQEVRSSSSRSSSDRFLHEQRHQFEIGSWLPLQTQDLIARPSGINAMGEKFPDTIFMLPVPRKEVE